MKTNPIMNLIQGVAFAALILLPSADGLASDLVSAFAGSELVGEYAADFDRFHYLGEAGAEILEGRIESRVYKKPTEKSTLEVYRSYENELKANGFEIVTAIDDDKKRLYAFSHEYYRDGGNRMRDRSYAVNGKPSPGSTADWVMLFPERYIAARKSDAGATTLVVVMISNKRDLYAVDVVEGATMEENTVSLNLDVLRARIASEGRVAVYDILFDTGSAAIRPESGTALDIVAQFIRESPDQRFYVVGHTDDEGAVGGNMRLSTDRAQATVNALTAKVPGVGARLTPHGVGPLSPVATNQQSDGRQRNRRVELVLRLE